MARRGKVIVSCAITGSIHVPSVSDYLPITPEEIADGAIGAAEAGAAIVHLHARDPQNGRPTPDPAIFAQFLPKIRHSCDAVINITTGGGHGMTLEERSAAARVFKPELCSMNMGSMNFGLFAVLDRVSEFKHSWEPEYLEASRDFIFRTPTRTSNGWSPSSALTAPGSSSNATTSVTSTTSRTAWTVDCCSRRCSSRRSSGSWAASGPRPRT